MTIHRMSVDELADDVRLGPRPPTWAVPGEPHVVLVDGRQATQQTFELPAHTAAVVVAYGWNGTPPPWCDTVCSHDDIDAIVRTVQRAPIASTALVQLLRDAPGRSMADGLLLESAVYSALQAGPEFAAWRATRTRRTAPSSAEPPVVVERDGDVLRVSLNRPSIGNALNAAMRDALIEVFTLAGLDTALTVDLRGNGANYSTGGDLHEFGTFGDAASAHLVRTTAALGPLMTDLGHRLTVTLHGACAGSGIELPAFSGRVAARADLDLWLPELSLGLIPGAGGTWSLPQRIGRHRTAWLALTGAHIGRDTALGWGLVDVADDS